VEAVLSTGPFFNGDAFSLVDAAYAPLFMRLQLLGQYATVFGKDGLPKMGAWSATLLALPAVIDSAVPDFAELYEKLVRRRQGYLSTLLSDEPLNVSTRRRY
jgi:glutathione S-transferase